MGALVDKQSHKRYQPEKTSVKDNEEDELEVPSSRYKPDGLEDLCRITHFTKKELQLMYRGFKQECPTGVIDKELFKEVFQRYFPQGNSSQYADYVYNTIDVNKNGSINFEEFAIVLSVLSRGSTVEKLHWAFTLYDINQSGYITRDEMLEIVSAIYDMTGRRSTPEHTDTCVRRHAEKIFKIMDVNRDGLITLDEFVDSCTREDEIVKSIAFFDTVFY